jgi:amino acid transporter
MSSDSFMLAGMADRGMLPAALSRRSKHGTPTLAIVLSSLGIACLAWLNFAQVVELLNFLYCIGAIIEFSAYIRLRHRRPEAFSDFRVALPTWAVALLLVPATLLISLVMTLASPQTVVLSLSIMMFGVLLQLLMSWLANGSILEFNSISYNGITSIPQEGSVGLDNGGAPSEVEMSDARETSSLLSEETLNPPSEGLSAKGDSEIT